MSFYKELLNEINSVRINPSGYIDKVLKYKEYFDGKTLKIPGEKAGIMTKEGPEAYDQAVEFLKTVQSCESFIPSKGLSKVSKDYLENIQKVGVDKINSIDINQIIDKYGQFTEQISTSMEFGSSTPEQIVISLLVCDGDSSRENREFLFNSILKKIGFASGKTDAYPNSTIIFAASEFKNKDDSDDTETFEENEVKNNESVPLPTLNDMLNPDKSNEEEEKKKREEEERLKREAEEAERKRLEEEKKKKEEEERLKREAEEAERKRLEEEEEKKKKEEEERLKREAEEAERKRLEEEEKKKKEEEERLKREAEEAERKKLEEEDLKKKEEEMKKKEIEEKEKEQKRKDEEERKRLEYKEKMQKELKINRKIIEEEEKQNLSVNQKEQDLLNTIILIYLILLFLFNN